MRLIFDMKMMTNQMKQIGYDSSKMPLGKLAKSTITKGYQALNKLMNEVKSQNSNQEILAHLSSEFYTYIPHDFGFKRMERFILNSQKEIKSKLQMLQSLQDIKIFTEFLDEGKLSSDMNLLDSNQARLNTQVEPLSEQSDDYRLIQRYVTNTHGRTHDNYKLKIQQVFTLNKKTQNQNYQKGIQNKQLLWHGSRLTNYVGILSKGLRIAPPEAPSTGYMFGKGIYFADMVSKSGNYCFANRHNSTGLMLLCEVALGRQNQLHYGDSDAHRLPIGKNSTKGIGRIAPLGGQKFNDIWVPNGRAKQSILSKGYLVYNQYIVYKVSQIICKYLIKMRFIYH